MTKPKVALGILALVASACATSTNQSTSTTVAETLGGCADVIAVEATSTGENTYNFAVTISSPDEGWDKYANSFEVRTFEGEVLGTRVLAHPHVDEQPFTRSLTGVEVTEDSVVVTASDLIEGFCGQELTVDLPE